MGFTANKRYSNRQGYQVAVLAILTCSLISLSF